MSEFINKDFLKKVDMLYLDFSAVVNIETLVFSELIHQIVEENIKIIISSEFYHNYDIVSRCSNEEQKNICDKAFTLLSELKEKNLLVTLEDIYDIREVLTAFKDYKNIGFVFYYISECFEAFVESDNNEDTVTIIKDYNSINIYANKADALNSVEYCVDKAVIDDSYLELPYIPKAHTALTTNSGDLQITTAIASGGEGEIYDCNYQKNYVVKVYHNGQLNMLRLKKLLVMERVQIRYNGICWPEKIVYLKSGEPVGFLIKKIAGKPLSLVFDSYEMVLKMFPKWQKTDLIDLCINILSAVQYLHLFGIIIGDLRMDNIILDAQGTPTLVDLDSCQISNLPSPTGFGEFTAPELQKVTFKNTLRTYRNESFSCSVLVFKILFCGLHPYDQKYGAETIEEEIKLQNFPYSLDVNDDFSKIVFGGYECMWKNTPYQMQCFFYDIFKSGFRPNIQTLIMLKTYKDFIILNKDDEKLNKIVLED